MLKKWMNQDKILPWLVLVGIIFIRGFANGMNAVSGLFLSPVSGELQVGIGTMSLYFSVMSAVQVIWFGQAGKLLNRYDVRLVAVVAAALQALTFAAFGLLNHVVGWYILAVLQAMGSAILVNLMGPILIYRWFPDKAGIILGVQSACVGLFGAVLQPVTSSIIAKSGWRSAYLVIGVAAFVIITAAALIFLKNRPREQEVIKAHTLYQTPKVTSPFRLVSFWALVIFMLALTGVAVFVQHIPTYGSLLGYSVTQVGTALSLASLGTAVGALLIGFLSDKIGVLKTCYLILGVWILAVIGFGFSGEHVVIFAISAFLNGVAVPSVTVISPVLTIAFFGKREYERIYAKVSMGAPLASIFLVPVYGFVYDATKSYTLVLFVLIGLLLLAGGSIAYGWMKRKSHKSEKANPGD